MRYIVLYILTFLWITTSESAAQKPTIDLLPSTHRQLHPEAVIDTISSNDSLVIVVAQHPAKKAENRLAQPIAPMRDSLFPKRMSRKTIVHSKPGMVPLIIKGLFPMRILFTTPL